MSPAERVSEQETQRRGAWRRPGLFTGIAGPAGRHDVVRRVATAFAHRYDMILGQTSRTFAAIGTAIPVCCLDRAPLVAGQSGRKKTLTSTTPLLVLYAPFWVATTASIVGSHAASPVVTIVAPLILLTALAFLRRSPLLLPSRFHQFLGRCQCSPFTPRDHAARATMTLWISFLPSLDLRLRLLRILGIVPALIAAITAPTAKMRLQLTTIKANLLDRHTSIIVRRVSCG